ncbi:Uncharacterized protein SCF082_LOCUS48021, partial [Durusdinium trenchii]
DKEETAQWVAAPGTFKNVIEACLTKISTMKYQTCIVHNFACYDGVLEKVVLDLMLDLSDLAYMAFYSECTNPTVFEFAVTTVKDKLLEEWKRGTGLIGQMQPKFVAEACTADLTLPQVPSLRLCTMDSNGQLSIPKAEREKWLSDPVRNPDWRVRLKNFDEVFRPSSSTESGRVPTQADAEVDLAKEGATATTAAKSSLHVECDPPPSLTKEEFEKKYPDIGATITLSVSGQNILCQYVDGKVFLSSATKTRAPGVASSSPTPLFLYAGGQ